MTMRQTYEIGSRVFDNWTITRRIGAGSYGTVYELDREDFGEVYRSALKVITVPRSDEELQGALSEGMTHAQAESYFYSVVEDIVREFAIMAKLKATANVVSYEDHAVIRHEDGIGWDILIRMELLTPVLTNAYAHPMARRDVIRLGIDICHALELCQKYNIIHRDIKPENIFVSENGNYKLGDFGIARTIERTTSGLSKKGTYNYMAPEVYHGGEYGFNVDIYSLGIVLYRLLNRNRIPFLPQPPAPIRFEDRDNALVRRMSGEPLPRPYYAEGRLAEIVARACAFNPRDRYSSPAQMRRELEEILYDAEDAELIYPSGDELMIAQNEYASSHQTDADRDSQRTVSGGGQTVNVLGGGGTVQYGRDRIDAGYDEDEFYDDDDGPWEDDPTQSAFGSGPGGSRDADDSDASRTESMFSSGGEKTSRTESVFSSGGEKTSRTVSMFPSGGGARTGGHASDADEKRKGRGHSGNKSQRRGRQAAGSRSVILIAAAAVAVVVIIVGAVVVIRTRSQAARERQYEELLSQASALCSTDAAQALTLYEQAQALNDTEPAAYTGYAYALYLDGQYAACITYIEDTLALGKSYDVSVQDQLSNILGAAYFEQEDYAQAASFFRLSTAGSDITVDAMRDYAVSLGRLGDVDAADEVLQQMYDAGASGDVTDYVQAEVDYARKEYLAAESGFASVMSSTQDTALQRRALRSLAELYRDCAALERTGDSPIVNAASKEAELLSNGMVQYGLNYDSTLWEMLALAYYEAWQTDASARDAYATQAADGFRKVIELGVQKDYLYSNLYTIYYALGDYEQAEQALQDYEAAFPDDYMPHALRGIMLITIENGKEQTERDYAQALSEYETAGEMIGSGDDTTYYQQLGSYIDELREKGWL